MKDIGALLDVLLAGIVRVPDVDAAIDACLAEPGAVVVTPEGDRFAPSSWQLGAAGTGATGAALDDARQRAAAASSTASSSAPL